ncbi:MAG: EF-hand domain-containing protein [Paracoccaceae bacterium]
MKRNTILALGLVAATALGSAVAIPVLAHGEGGWGRGEAHRGAMMDGPGMMQMMMRHMQGQGFGAMGKMGGLGMMGGLMADLDADGDGTLTADEARTGLQLLLTKYDADGNGTLSLDEFAALHADALRERMVDRFQALDNDGDGQVTADEITVPADMIARMQEMHDAMQDGHGPARKGGSMMDDN